MMVKWRILVKIWGMTPILLGRPFLATAGAIVDVKGARIAFRVSDKMVGFGMETVNKDPFDFSCCMIDDHSVK